MIKSNPGKSYSGSSRIERMENHFRKILWESTIGISRAISQNHVIDGFGLKGALKIILFQPPAMAFQLVSMSDR